MFRPVVDVQIGRPRDFAAGMRQTLHQSDSHRIAAAHEDDRDAVGRRLGGFGGVPAFGRYDDVHAVSYELASGLGKLRRIALSEAHPDHEVLVFTVSKLLQARAETNDRWCRPPGFCQRTNLDQTRRRCRAGEPHQPNDRETGGKREQAKAECPHRAPRIGAGSASKASKIARASGLPQSRGPTASATARPSRPMRKVDGRPTPPYDPLILPSRSRTSGKLRPRSLAYRRAVAGASRVLMPMMASPRDR